MITRGQNMRHFKVVNTNQFSNRIITLEMAKKNIDQANGVLRAYIKGDVDGNLKKKVLNNALNASRLTYSQMEESGMIARAIEELNKIITDDGRKLPFAQLQEIKESVLKRDNTDPDVSQESRPQEPRPQEEEKKTGSGIKTLPNDAIKYISDEPQKPVVEVKANLKVDDRPHEPKRIINKSKPIKKIKPVKTKQPTKKKVGGSLNKTHIINALKKLNENKKGSGLNMI